MSNITIYCFRNDLRLIDNPAFLKAASESDILLPLAITSSDKMMRKLKFNWKRLHRLIYLIAILGVLHFVWLVKKDVTEPLIYAAIILVLFLLRLNIFKLKRI